jgi:cyclopropane fatty-acyl-phospholipid synthase-like methyltransferase
MARPPKRQRRHESRDEGQGQGGGHANRAFRSDRPEGPRPLTRGDAGAGSGAGRSYRVGGKKPRYPAPTHPRGSRPGGPRPPRGQKSGPPPVKEHPQYGRNIPPEELEILRQIQRERAGRARGSAGPYPRRSERAERPDRAPAPREGGRAGEPGRRFRVRKRPNRVGVQRAGEGPPRPAPAPEDPALQRFARLMFGYRGTAAILAAHSLGLFTEIHRQPQIASDLARRCHADPRGVERLLNALVAVGILHLHGSTYVLPRDLAPFVVRGADGDATGLLDLETEMYAAWGNLAHGIRTGTPLYRLGSDALLSGDIERVRRYIRAVHTGSREAARRVADLAPLPPGSSLLDVAGGSGIYSAEFARRAPGLSALLFDLAPTIEVSREILAAEGLDGRVEYRVGDYRYDPFPGPVDAILLSNLLQTESVERAKQILAKAREALRPGGTLLVHGIMTDRAGIGPPLEPVIFSLLMLVAFDDGRAYSAEQITEWLTETGFGVRSTRPLGPPLPSTLIQATRLP